MSDYLKVGCLIVVVFISAILCIALIGGGAIFGGARINNPPITIGTPIPNGTPAPSTNGKTAPQLSGPDEIQLQAILAEELKNHPGNTEQAIKERIDAAIKRIDNLSGDAALRWSADLNSPKTIDFGKRSYVWMSTKYRHPSGDPTWQGVSGYTVNDYGIWIVSGSHQVFNGGAAIVLAR